MNYNRKKENESEGAWIDRGGRGGGEGISKERAGRTEDPRIHGSET